jgi:hypothetical protein
MFSALQIEEFEELIEDFETKHGKEARVHLGG